MCGVNFHVSLLLTLDVMGPDEWHSPVNNSVFTNAAAVQSMMTALYAASLANQSASPEWINVVNTMYIPFDEEQLYHPEYDNYVRGTCLVGVGAKSLVGECV